jgi:hypothetical protein
LAADALRLKFVELWSLEVGHVKISPTAIVARRVASEIQQWGVCINSVKTGVVNRYKAQAENPPAPRASSASTAPKPHQCAGARKTTHANTNPTTNDDTQIPRAPNTITRDIELLKC